MSRSAVALEEALARYGTPEIVNTDQASQFTSVAFTGALAGAGIKISRWRISATSDRGHHDEGERP